MFSALSGLYGDGVARPQAGLAGPCGSAERAQGRGRTEPVYRSLNVVYAVMDVANTGRKNTT